MKKEFLFCDRCGHPILISPREKLEHPRPWKIREKHIITTIWFQICSKNETCDYMHELCNDCMTEFIDWWQKGKEGR